MNHLVCNQIDVLRASLHQDTQKVILKKVFQNNFSNTGHSGNRSVIVNNLFVDFLSTGQIFYFRQMSGKVLQLRQFWKISVF